MSFKGNPVCSSLNLNFKKHSEMNCGRKVESFTESIYLISISLLNRVSIHKNVSLLSNSRKCKASHFSFQV